MTPSRHISLARESRSCQFQHSPLNKFAPKELLLGQCLPSVFLDHSAFHPVWHWVYLQSWLLQGVRRHCFIWI